MTPQDQFVIIVFAAQMNANTMQHLNDEGLTRGQGLVNARVRNVQPMAQPPLPPPPSENALAVGTTTSKIFQWRGNLVELQLLQLCGLMGIGSDSNPHFHLLVLNSLRLCTLVQRRTIVIRSVYVAVLFEIILTELLISIN